MQDHANLECSKEGRAKDGLGSKHDPAIIKKNVLHEPEKREKNRLLKAMAKLEKLFPVFYFPMNTTVCL